MNLPNLDPQPDEARDPDDPIRFIVKNVEQDDRGLKHVEKDGADGQALEVLAVVPELDV